MAVLPELIHQLPERAVPVAELLGDVLRRTPVEEDGAEGLVAAVEGLFGL